MLTPPPSPRVSIRHSSTASEQLPPTQQGPTLGSNLGQSLRVRSGSASPHASTASLDKPYFIKRKPPLSENMHKQNQKESTPESSISTEIPVTKEDDTAIEIIPIDSIKIPIISDIIDSPSSKLAENIPTITNPKEEMPTNKMEQPTYFNISEGPIRTIDSSQEEACPEEPSWAPPREVYVEKQVGKPLGICIVGMKQRRKINFFSYNTSVLLYY